VVYDGDGNRVQKTIAGVTTSFLVELQGGTVVRKYTYGLEQAEE
jgi:hypothetical protein